MKLILKLFVLPVLLILVIFCLLGKLAQNLSGYAFSILMLIIVGCVIASIVQAKWQSLAILVGMAVAAFLILFVIVATCFTAEGLRDRLRDFIRS